MSLGKNPLLLFSLGFLGVLALLALTAPLWMKDPTLIQPDAATIAPFQSIYWLGTDDLGRDLLARLMVGARISLMIGLATAVVSLFIGTTYGVIAGYLETHSRWGERIARLMMSVIDVLYSLPGLMVVILLTVFWGRNVFSLVMALSLFSWPDTAKVIRGEVQHLAQEEFMEAARQLGNGIGPLLWRHLLPNLTGLMILTTTMTVPRAILTESTLSFIGLGVEPPLSSWGTLASEGWQLVRVAPHLLLLPAGAIFLTMVTLNMVGDALQQRFNPKSA